jgi:drug/metabolite transporter (DMT)-like permease
MMLSPRLGILMLVGVSTGFAANHLAARIAFDHGASVAMAVGVRATVTALVLFLTMRLQSVALAIPRHLRGAALLAGVLIAGQSYCLYSAVAIIPPGLALLVFQTSPILYVLLTWALGKEAPRRGALIPMVLAVVGLALALDLRLGELAARWDDVGAGVLWAFASAGCMTVVYYLNANALRPIDGRLRTFTMVSVTAVLVLAAAGSAGALALPAAPAGWVGLALLSLFYCVSMIGLFYVIARVAAHSTAALNFEPIALLGLGWIVLGHALSSLQLAGAVVTVGSIVWLSLGKEPLKKR